MPQRGTGKIDHSEEKAKREEKAKVKAEKDFLNQQLIALDLPNRLFDILSNSSYVTIGDIVKQIDQDEQALLDLEGFGPKSLDQVKEKLETAKANVQAIS